MISVWRIVKSERQATAFDGEGARRYGGRWNEVGISMIYASGSLSLATLEYFVNLDALPPLALSLVSIEARVPIGIIEDIGKSVPKGWDSLPATHEAKSYGTHWINRQSSAVLKVPSAVIPNEFNYLLNPHHPDFKRIAINPAIPFSLDSRMWKTKTH